MKRKLFDLYFLPTDSCYHCLNIGYGAGKRPGESFTLTEAQLRCWREEEGYE